jgi:hypothetical protein
MREKTIEPIESNLFPYLHYLGLLALLRLHVGLNEEVQEKEEKR